MDKWTSFLTVLYLVCLSESFGTEFYDGSGGSGDGETTVDPTSTSTSTVPPTTSLSTTGPPEVEERVTMVLQGVNKTHFEAMLEDDFKVSISTYVQLYCSQNTGECVPTQYLRKSLEIEVYEQIAEDDRDMFLTIEKKLSEVKGVDKISETQQYLLNVNVTIGPDDVIITSTDEEGGNLNVIYYVNAISSNGETIVIPQVMVEATLDAFESNITEDLGGVEFDYIPDAPPPGGDDGDALEPWAIALICCGSVAVVGGAGYFVYKQQGGKKKKKKSEAYFDDFSSENFNNSSNKHMYTKNHEQRSSYGSASASYKYENPTYDNNDEKLSSYKDVDLESGSSSERRTSL